jgi:hypothetical protein
VKLTLLAVLIGGLVIVARKLMGGLGPQPGSTGAPKEWPSLVPDPPAPSRAPQTAPPADEVAGAD